MNDELGFEHLTKKQLVRFCKKFHKDCYRLVGQKMKLKDQRTQAKEIIKKFLLWENDWHEKTESKYELLKEAEKFLKETE